MCKCSCPLYKATTGQPAVYFMHKKKVKNLWASRYVLSRFAVTCVSVPNPVDVHRCLGNSCNSWVVLLLSCGHVDVNRRLGYGWNSWAVLICGYIDDGRWLGYRWNFWSMLSCGHWWWQMAGGRYGWRTLALSHLGKKCQTAWKHHLSNENCRSVIMSEIYLKISGNILHFLDC